jgi:hypothetical protein
MERLRKTREVGECQYIIAHAMLARQQYALAAAKPAQQKGHPPPLFEAEHQAELASLQTKAAELVTSLPELCARFSRLREAAVFEEEFKAKVRK